MLFCYVLFLTIDVSYECLQDQTPAGRWAGCPSAGFGTSHVVVLSVFFLPTNLLELSWINNALIYWHLSDGIVGTWGGVWWICVGFAVFTLFFGDLTSEQPVLLEIKAIIINYHSLSASSNLKKTFVWSLNGQGTAIDQTPLVTGSSQFGSRHKVEFSRFSNVWSACAPARPAGDKAHKFPLEKILRQLTVGQKMVPKNPGLVKGKTNKTWFP